MKTLAKVDHTISNKEKKGIAVFSRMNKQLKGHLQERSWVKACESTSKQVKGNSILLKNTYQN